MKRYLILIKSHCEYPDFEGEVMADSAEEAVEKFYELLKGEYDRDFIRTEMASEDEINK